MITVNALTFNAIQTNTYLLSDETGECAIVDPACQTKAEQQLLSDFIAKQSLKPVALWFTHLHFDHIYGARYVIDNYNLTPMASASDLYLLDVNKRLMEMWGIDAPEQFAITSFIDEESSLSFGNSRFRALLIPGHSAGSLAFVSSDESVCISGDALFRMSIGRTDIGGSTEEDLIASIRTKIFALPDNTVIYPGHGPSTTVGYERHYNPYFL